MKCKNCGAELSIINDKYSCDFCGSSFLKEELVPQPSQNREFKIVGGVLISYFGNQSQVIIPSGTLSVGKDAFKNNIAIKKVIFPETLVSIENNAFEGCTNLAEIEGYSNVTRFGDEAFKTSGLKQISIGNKVEFIGKWCFSRMPNLEVISYNPGKILRLFHTFAYCPNLREVKEESKNFLPSIRPSTEVRNNINDKRPTWGDAFIGTPYIRIIMNQYTELYNKGICPQCGGNIKKGIFHAKCQSCGLDLKN